VGRPVNGFEFWLFEFWLLPNLAQGHKLDELPKVVLGPDLQAGLFLLALL